MSNSLQSHRVIESIDLVSSRATVCDNATKTNSIIFGLRFYRSCDPVHRKYRVKIVCCDNQCSFSVLKRRGETTTHYVTQDIKNDNIGIVE